jgi:hypothetical protein
MSINVSHAVKKNATRRSRVKSTPKEEGGGDKSEAEQTQLTPQHYALFWHQDQLNSQKHPSTIEKKPAPAHLAHTAPHLTFYT